ncbi:MAG: LysM peptidoglycan-binding domain-containing protein [Luteolibacter sp.]
MKMKSRLATLLVILATTGPLLSATEVERLRALCAEQEMQIRQLELKISRLTDTPPPARTEASTVSAPQAPAGATYTVKSGDSIERIARKSGVSVASLSKLNGLTAASIIHPGQTIKLPGSTAAAATTPENSPTATETRKHTVQSGETYYKISMKYGVSVDDLIAANPRVNPRALRVGQKVNVSKPVNEVTKKTTSTPTPTPSFSSPPSISISNSPAPAPKPRASDRPIRIDKEITYGQFAKNHNTTTSRLDDLNGLELDPSTVLAQSSELYIPAQP